MEIARICYARRIVELGSGTGGVTRAILGAMPPDARLLSIEINPSLCDVVERISDERLILHCGDAGNLAEIISRYGFNAPDVVISGVPISTMAQLSASRLIEAVASALAPQGSFVAYQVSKKIESLCSSHLDPETLERCLVVRNFPPLWVMRWEKAAISEQPSVH